MHRIRVVRILAQSAAIAAAAALGGCVAYPAPYGGGYGYYGSPYGYSYPAYTPAPVFGFNFGGRDRDDWHNGWRHRDWR